MNIGETLRFYRKKLNITQKEMLDNHIDPSSYSRIEHGKQHIRIDTLTEVLKKLSLSSEEFFSRISLDPEQKKFRELFYGCSENRDDYEQKKRLIQYYNVLLKKQKSLQELSNFIVIKSYFSQYWQEIDPITDKEVQETANYLLKKDYYQQYDYIIISNVIRFFDTDLQDRIITRAIPIADENLRDHTTKIFAYSTITNLITSRIYEKDYSNAQKYLIFANKQDPSGANYNYRMNLQYLHNLLQYLLTGNYKYMEHIHAFIRLLENIGDVSHADIIKKEVKFLTHSHFSNTNINELPIGIFKY